MNFSIMVLHYYIKNVYLFYVNVKLRFTMIITSSFLLLQSVFSNILNDIRLSNQTKKQNIGSQYQAMQPTSLLHEINRDNYGFQKLQLTKLYAFLFPFASFIFQKTSILKLLCSNSNEGFYKLLFILS